METKTETLTAIDFFEKLQKGKLDKPLPFGIIGMVKKSEGKEKTIEFAAGGNCSNWITIPLEFIENVEMIRTIPCKDHSHPLVKLNMKNPKTPEGKIFFVLLETMIPSYEDLEQWTEAHVNEFQDSNNNMFNTGFWGCSNTYCGCDNFWDCIKMISSGKCRGRKLICGRNKCVCIPITR